MALKELLEDALGIRITGIFGVSGGDIAEAYRLETDNTAYFCKLLPSDTGWPMLQSEKNALESIRATRTIATPSVIHCGRNTQKAFLIMEYIESETPTASELFLFGKQLAQLHQCSSSGFGWTAGNYIGSLRQSNVKRSDWVDFYVKERLLPQLKLATNHGLLSYNEVPSAAKMQKVLDSLMPQVRPALLHGDLWGGNYLISKGGQAFLIDPATYYGHSEVDLAMSRLFGGFGREFYSGYHELLPEIPGQEERMQLYQLYYLLVHLNLFGRSYYASVQNILNKYF